jgi:hypothetical protein
LLILQKYESLSPAGHHLNINLNTTHDGVQTGTAVLAPISDGSTIDTLGTTALTRQTISTSGTLFNLATASAVGTVNFSIVHVGDGVSDQVTKTVSVTNTAIVDSFSENLDATIGGASAPFIASGGFTELAAGATNAANLLVTLNTGTAGVFNAGTATITATSDGTGIDTLGTTGIGTRTVALTGTVDNYALAAWEKISGAGTLTRSTIVPADWSINLGLIVAGSAAPMADLEVLNAATGQSDLMEGTFQLGGTSGFINTGFGAFSGLGAGQADAAPVVGLSTSLAGIFTETVTLSATGYNSSSYSGGLAAQVLTITGTIVAKPTIAGTTGNQADSDDTPIALFAGVAISDTGINQTETVTVTPSAPGDGFLGNTGGWTFNPATGAYTMSNTPGAVTAALDALTFSPVPTPEQSNVGQPVTAGFTIQVTDSAGVSATDTTTSVVTNPAQTDTWDLNGDGTSDVLFDNSSGVVGFWTVLNGVESSASILDDPGTAWTVVGEGDFGGGVTSDVLLTDTSGDVGEWVVQNGQVQSAKILGAPGNSWTLIGTGALNGPGNTDVLFRAEDGTLADWEVTNNQVTEAQVVGNIASNWSLAAVGDLTGNGIADLLFIGTDGTVADWWIQNGKEVSAHALGNVGSAWSIVGIGDLNGSGQNDILFQNNSNGDLAAWMMQNGAVIGVQDFGAPGASWQVVGIGDYNGDGTSDVLFRNTDGTMAEWLMKGGVAAGSAQVAKVVVMGGITPDWTVTPVHAGVTLPS